MRDLENLWQGGKKGRVGRTLDNKKNQTIELDCRPGHPRPGDLIDDVTRRTGLPKREPVSRLFGNWTWDYNDIPADQWRKIKPILKERISALYDRGIIRYGSW